MELAHNTRALSNSSNPGKTAWSIINTRSPHLTIAPSNNFVLLENNKQILDPKSIADIFSNEFNKFSTFTTQKVIIPLHSNSTTIKFPLLPLSNSVTYDILRSLKNKRTSGLDEVPCFLLKQCAAQLATPLTFLINHSFSTGTFPTHPKRSKIIPLHKKGPKTDKLNFRPIYIPSSFSRIFEIAFYQQYLPFLLSFLSDGQHGFVPSHSTITAMYDLLSEAYSAVDVGDNIFAFFYDYSKAFDSIIHQILINRQFEQGMDSVSLSWVASFLSDRPGVVVVRHTSPDGHITDTLSDPAISNCGCPQGSILGPPLFNTYSNSIFSKVMIGLLVVYADDTNHIIRSNSLIETINKAREGLTQMQTWSNQNKLIINLAKTTFMQFHTKQKPPLLTPLFKMDNKIIQSSNHTKFLGLNISDTFDWSEHCQITCNKLRSCIFLMKSLKCKVPVHLLRTVYYGNFYSHVQYGIIFWGFSSCAHRIFILQKRAVRGIFGISQRTSCVPYFKELNILTLPSIFIYECAKFAKQHPERFVLNNAVHPYPTRGRNDIHIPNHRLALCDKNPSYIVPLIYNKLPQNIKDAPSYATFKKRLFNFLVQNAFYTVQQFLG